MANVSPKQILHAYLADLRTNAEYPLQGAAIIRRFHSIAVDTLGGGAVLAVKYMGFAGEIDKYVGNKKAIKHDFGALLLYPVGLTDFDTSDDAHLDLQHAFTEYHMGLHARGLTEAQGAQCGRIESATALLDSVVADLQDVWHVAAYTVSWTVTRS